MMKRVGLLVVGALLGGCLHSASPEVKQELAPASAPAAPRKAELSEAVLAGLIVKGKTTQKEVLAALGSPIAVEQNSRQLSRELLSTIKAPLPPIARTKEFWRYNSPPFTSDGALKQRILSVMIFFDHDEVAVDYLTSYTDVVSPL